MTLSYSVRLLCILTVVSGLVLAISQLALAAARRRLLDRLAHATPRWRERILFLVQLAPALLAGLVALGVCLPEYLCDEANHGPESISLVCLIFTTAVLLWFACAWLRGLHILVRTLRFARMCRRLGSDIPDRARLPILSVPAGGPPIRLIGFLRPFILISAPFTGAAPDALDLALAHERSHARHGDNWKLLALSFLPRLDRMLPGDDPWLRSWQQAADWAADDDAIAGDPSRALLLAQVIVLAARAANSAPAPGAAYLCTALTGGDAALATRIDRLLLPTQAPHPSHSAALYLAGTAVLVASALAAVSPWIYALSEHLLHLGGF